MQIRPYLNFNGDCRAAFEFYEQCLGGKIAMIQTHGESAMAEQVPPDWRDRVIHVRLEAGEAILMGSDSPPDQYQKPQGIYVSLDVEDAADAERIFAALAEGGSVQMPLEQSFFALRFGMLTDRFGIPWMVNCEGPA